MKICFKKSETFVGKDQFKYNIFLLVALIRRKKTQSLMRRRGKGTKSVDTTPRSFHVLILKKENRVLLWLILFGTNSCDSAKKWNRSEIKKKETKDI